MDDYGCMRRKQIFQQAGLILTFQKRLTLGTPLPIHDLDDSFSFAFLILPPTYNFVFLFFRCFGSCIQEVCRTCKVDCRGSQPRQSFTRLGRCGKSVCILTVESAKTSITTLEADFTIRSNALWENVIVANMDWALLAAVGGSDGKLDLYCKRAYWDTPGPWNN